MPNSRPANRDDGFATFRIKVALFILCFALLAGCREGMSVQPRYDPLEASDFFADQRSARPLIPGTVPRGALQEEDDFYTGRTGDGELLEGLPLEITVELLERGRERYDIFCTPCHGLDGYGRGIIVQRGFTPPESFHTDRLRQAPDGYFFDVISNGTGRMYAYAYRIAPADRWAIVAYIRSLQLSQYAPQQVLTPEDLRNLQEAQ